jgi:hypothetical protein
MPLGLMPEVNPRPPPSPAINAAKVKSTSNVPGAAVGSGRGGGAFTGGDRPTTSAASE